MDVMDDQKTKQTTLQKKTNEKMFKGNACNKNQNMNLTCAKQYDQQKQ